MAFIVKKRIAGREYYYLRESKRDKKTGKVKAKTRAYLGKSKEEAEKKYLEIMNKIKGKGKDKVNKDSLKDSKMENGNVKITYFVHGTTKDNKTGVSTGQLGGELTELGIKQSEELPSQIKEKNFDVVFCSDLKRAIDSAEISFKGKYKIIQDKRLRECNYGDLNGAEEDKVVYEEHVTKKFPNGESMKDVENRINDFINFLKKNYAGKHIAIVAHKATQFAFEVLTKGISWEQALKEDWRKKKAWKPGWVYVIGNNENKASNEKNSKLSVDDLAVFCKRKGFVFKSSEIYGGFSGFWDYGPLGAELFNNIKNDFWKFFVHQKKNMVGIDASIISHPKTWEASGHVSSFSDVAVVCKKCKNATKLDKSEVGKVKCDKCGGEYNVLGEFSLMFKTKVGALNAVDAYLRGETAQGMFLDFKQIYDTARVKLPFGVLQVGKCFRNEIAPRDFVFRCREFTIGEFEFFIHPESDDCDLLTDKHLNLKLKLLDAETQDAEKEDLRETTIGEMLKDKRLGNWHAYWLAEQLLWFKRLGLLENIKVREHKKSELSHYSSATFDMDYMYPFGSKEVAGNANRGQYDLKQHENFSKEKMEVFDEKSGKRVIPRVIEPTFGMDRVFLAVITKGYEFDEKRQNVILKLPAFLAPIKASVFPIIKDDKMIKIAEDIYDMLRMEWNVSYDASGSVGRRYSRADEIGTPMCITVDEETEKDKSVTIRDRDSTEQVRVKIGDLKEIMRKVVIDGENVLKLGKKVETRVK